MMDDLDRHIQEQVEADPAFADLLREAEAEVDFGLALAHLREKRGWTQRELASRAAMPQSAIARLEKAGRTPTLVTLWRLADALDAVIVLCPGYTVRLLDRLSGDRACGGGFGRRGDANGRDNASRLLRT